MAVIDMIALCLAYHYATIMCEEMRKYVRRKECGDQMEAAYQVKHMLIIWGTKTFSKIVGTTPGSYECPHCHNIYPCNLVKHTKWFTLFWIPLFPISVKRYVACPVCNFGRSIKKEEMQNFMNGIVG